MVGFVGFVASSSAIMYVSCLLAVMVAGGLKPAKVKAMENRELNELIR